MEFRKAYQQDVDSVAKLLAESFLEYPLFLVVERDRMKRYRLIYELQYINTMLYITRYQCFVAVVDKNIVGVSLLKSLKEKKNDFVSYLRFGLYRLVKGGLIIKALQFIKLVDSTNEPIQKCQSNGWYLDSFAISKKVQGAGLGSKMLQNFLFPYVSENGGGTLWLATNTELNRKFYIKNGFHEFKEEDLSLGEHKVKNWSYHMQIKSTI